MRPVTFIRSICIDFRCSGTYGIGLSTEERYSMRSSQPLSAMLQASAELYRYVKKYTVTTSICAIIILKKLLCEVKR